MAEIDLDLLDQLPELMHPFLEYIHDFLSPYAYGSFVFNTILNIFAHAYTIIAALVTLVLSVFSDSDVPWSERLHVEKILPPLITLLTAYLALVTFYRTTGYFVRTLFGVLKWSFILTTLGGLAGYFIANAGVEGGARGAGGLAKLGLGLIPALGSVINEILNGKQPGTQSRTGARSTQTRSSTKSKKSKAKHARPKAYETWDKHREWQYTEDADRQGGGQAAEEVQKFIGNIIGTVKERAPGWWEAAKEAVEGLAQGQDVPSDSSDSASSTEKKKKVPKDKANTRSR